MHLPLFEPNRRRTGIWFKSGGKIFRQLCRESALHPPSLPGIFMPGRERKRRGKEGAQGPFFRHIRIHGFNVIYLCFFSRFIGFFNGCYGFGRYEFVDTNS